MVLEQRYDAKNGGFGTAPNSAEMVLDFLLRHWKRTGTGEALEIVVNSLSQKWHAAESMIDRRRIRSLLGRRDWLVPHFEKMLYETPCSRGWGSPLAGN